MGLDAPETDTQDKVRAFRYGVVDLAVAQDVCPLVMGLRRSVAVTLFARDAPRAVQEVGPFLIRMSEAPEVDAALASAAPDHPWGYYLHSTFDLISLRHSLRRFNLAKLPDIEREVLFRYWDPRVMRVFLDVATSQQREKFFEIIDRVESGDGSFDEVAPRRID